MRVLVMCACWALCAASAAASEPPSEAPGDVPDIAALERRIADLEARLKAREQHMPPPKPTPAPPPAPPLKSTTFTAAPGKGMTVETGDGRFAITLRARAAIRDTIAIDNKDAVTNEINVRFLRLILQGHVLVPELRYFIHLGFGASDFEVGNPSPIFDAYVEYTRLRDLNVRFGQFFVPFDRARTIREFALQFVDRQQPVQELNLDRDIGIMFSSQDLFGSHGILSYNLYLGSGDGKNRIGAQSIGFLYVLRLAVRPWGAFDDDVEGDLLRLRRPRLAIGVAGGYNHGTNRQKSTSGTTFASDGADYGHAAADLVFKHSGFYLLAEVLYRQARQDTVGAEFSRSGWGWFVQAGQMLHPLVELAARYDQLYAFTGTDPALIKLVQDSGQQAGACLNIYLNGHLFKIQTDYFYIFGYDQAAGKHQVRIQLDATF